MYSSALYLLTSTSGLTSPRLLERPVPAICGVINDVGNALQNILKNGADAFKKTIEGVKDGGEILLITGKEFIEESGVTKQVLGRAKSLEKFLNDENLPPWDHCRNRRVLGCRTG